MAGEARRTRSTTSKPKQAPREAKKKGECTPPEGPRVGDWVVCPPHGLGKLVAVNQGPGDLIQLEIPSVRLRMLVPARNIGKFYIRPLVPQKTARAMLKILRSPAAAGELRLNWTKWQKEWLATLSAGAPLESAQIVRDLSARRSVKYLAAWEVHLLDMARRLVLEEVAMVLGYELEQLEERLRRWLSPKTKRRRR